MYYRACVDFPTVIDKEAGECRVDFGDGDIFKMSTGAGFSLATAGTGDKVAWLLEDGASCYLAYLKAKEAGDPSLESEFLDNTDFDEVIAFIKDMIRKGEQIELARMAVNSGFHDIVNDCPGYAMAELEAFEASLK